MPFPVLASYIDQKRLTRFEAAVAILSDGVAEGSIPNARYNEAKETVSRTIEIAWTSVQQQVQLPKAYTDVYVSSLPAFIRTLNRVNSTHFVEKVGAFVAEVTPVVQAIITLKDKAVKRNKQNNLDRPAVRIESEDSKIASALFESAVSELKRHYRNQRLHYWRVSTLVGAIGGVVGGFTAFSGAAVVVWTGLQGLPKGDTRSIVQPYILGMQLVSLVTLAGGHADVFRWELWSVLLTTMPFVLPCTLLGVHLYRNLSDINFRRITFILLGVSGFTLVTKGLIGLAH